MLRKLVRAVFTIVGAVLGYGAFLLVKFLARFFGHDDWVNFTNMQEFYISVSFALIFGLIFFQLTPTIKKQGNKMADNIESDLRKVSTNDIVMGTVGLIAGLIIAFLISQIYAGIKIPYLSVILNVITYIHTRLSRDCDSDKKGLGYQSVRCCTSETERFGDRQGRQDQVGRNT